MYLKILEKLLSNQVEYMSLFDEIEKQLEQSGAFIAGGQSPETITAAEAKLGVTFPPSFREYLLRWGNISFDGYEYYGLTKNTDFENASVPNCVWFTLRKRSLLDLPDRFIVFRNENDEVYYCLDMEQMLEEKERGIAIWDNLNHSVSQTLNINFIEFLHEELSEFLEEN